MAHDCQRRSCRPLGLRQLWLSKCVMAEHYRRGWRVYEGPDLVKRAHHALSRRAAWGRIFAKGWSRSAPAVVALDLDAVHEGGAGTDEGDQVGPVDAAPARLGGLQQLVGHRQPGAPAARALGLVGPEPDRREG